MEHKWIKIATRCEWQTREQMKRNKRCQKFIAYDFNKFVIIFIWALILWTKIRSTIQRWCNETVCDFIIAHLVYSDQQTSNIFLTISFSLSLLQTIWNSSCQWFFVLSTVVNVETLSENTFIQLRTEVVLKWRLFINFPKLKAIIHLIHCHSMKRAHANALTVFQFSVAFSKFRKVS